jgi:hypothetical protein
MGHDSSVVVSGGSWGNGEWGRKAFKFDRTEKKKKKKKKKTQKKNNRMGRGEADVFYRRAKDLGYRARSAFKLIQVDEQYNIFEG